MKQPMPIFRSVLREMQRPGTQTPVDHALDHEVRLAAHERRIHNHPCPCGNATDLWHVKKVNPSSMVHLTEKPVELAVRAIQYSSRQGENVLDLFGGSGSTLIGCQQTGRQAYLMEMDPLYSDVIVQRFEKFTGKKAERVAAAVAAVRV